MIPSSRRDLAWYATIIGTIIAVLGFLGYQNYEDILRKFPEARTQTTEALSETKPQHMREAQIVLEFWSDLVVKARAQPGEYPHELEEAITILGESGSTVGEQTLTDYLGTDCIETSSHQTNICHHVLEAIERLHMRGSCDDLTRLRLRNSQLAGHAEQVFRNICSQP